MSKSSVEITIEIHRPNLFLRPMAEEKAKRIEILPLHINLLVQQQ